MSTIKITENKNELIKHKIEAFLINYFNLLAFGLAAVVLIGGLLFFIKPKYSEIKQKIQLSSENNKEKQATLAGELAELNKIKSDYEKIDSNNIKKIEAMLPSGELYEELFAKIEVLTLKNGLMLSSIKIEPEGAAAKGKNKNEEDGSASNEAIKNVAVSIDIVGADYQGLKNFLSVLENNLQLLDVEKIEFSPANKTAILEMRAYYYAGDSGKSSLNLGIFNDPKFQSLRDSGPADSGRINAGNSNPFERPKKEAVDEAPAEN